MASPPFNILISAAGRRVGLLQNFRDSLKQLDRPGRLLAADLTPMASAYQLADASFFAPEFHSDQFISQMLDICRTQQVNLLVPTVDPELVLYAAHADAFAQCGTHVVISAPEVVAICNDKQQTQQWLSQRGFPTPRQASVSQFRQEMRTWQWPLVVKPRFGSSSVGVKVVHDEQEFDVATRDGEFVVQSQAQGQEYTVDVYVDAAGRCRCAVPRLRIETRGGEVTKGITVRHRGMQQMAALIAEALPGARGVLNIQIFYDPARDRMKVIEINSRFGGGYPLTHEAGAPFARWLIEEALGLELTAQRDAWHDRLVMLRYDEAVFVSEDEVAWHRDAARQAFVPF